MKMQQNYQSKPLEISGLIRGVFLYEEKNRFLCVVRIQNEEVSCYVPSSCRLSNFLNLREREVLLLPVADTAARTRYSVFAVRYKRSYILLNTSLPNKIVESSIHGRRFSFLGSRRNVDREKRISNYKCDLYIEDTNTIVEIKSIISSSDSGVFPTVYSERALRQLHSIKELLKQGYRVVYLLVSLSPYVKRIRISDMEPFASCFEECCKLGMTVKGFCLRLDDNQIRLCKSIEIDRNPPS